MKIYNYFIAVETVQTLERRASPLGYWENHHRIRATFMSTQELWVCDRFDTYINVSGISLKITL